MQICSLANRFLSPFVKCLELLGLEKNMVSTDCKCRASLKMYRSLNPRIEYKRSSSSSDAGASYFGVSKDEQMIITGADAVEDGVCVSV